MQPSPDPSEPYSRLQMSDLSGSLDSMHTSSPYGRARGDFERTCRAAFKTLEKSPGPSAVEALDAVQLAADRLLSSLVDEMRSAGATWAQVGDTLGCSRQAAWERFGS